MRHLELIVFVLLVSFTIFATIEMLDALNNLDVNKIVRGVSK